MKISQWLLKHIAPICERTRMDYRMSASRAQATAENLSRTLVMDGAQIVKAIEQYKRK